MNYHKQKDQRNKIQPMEVLNDAYFNTKCQGSSTTCILTLMCDIVHTVNLGDSGFVAIRDRLGNGVKFDDSSAIQEINVTVRTWDVIVMFTDGLFDNVHYIELEKLVRDGLVDLCELGIFWRNCSCGRFIFEEQ
ncbi:hypothetical protein KY290_021024 [Solanum tuberosum]|uniref:Protein phosphatase n=1 Tax=Solanum tuberosum TaxID=4113 RepID=A0ABQ7V0F1_SOLTU|nr:hypothetical protein KY289_020207 [Solanum tuberosum]KAH0692872.1 hypothetical protein KY285_019969 [Solanum tuberosum]KAH0757531.1 hypothetical protein KY290_021024 [Solanum tuberosum]